MSKTKSTGSAKSLRDSKPKYLGLKVGIGQKVLPGAILLRQRGTRILPGLNVGVGKDHTLFATAGGTVQITHTRKKRFDGTVHSKKILNVVATENNS